MQDFLYQTYYHNTVFNYLLFAGCLLLSVAVVKIITHLVFKRLHAWAQKTDTALDAAGVRGLRRVLTPILYFAAFLLSTKILVLGDSLVQTLNTVTLAFVALVGAALLSRVTAFLLNVYWQKKRKGSDNELALKWVAGMLRFLIWCIVLVLFLDNIGVKINTLIAGLGIGGLAIAFAAQEILGDVFCFFTILFDRPFEIGDFIIAGEQMGTVEHIGVKTTRLRALSGEQLIFSNTDLTGSRIRNYKTMEQRRVLFTLGVTYDTNPQVLQEIPALLKQIIEGVGETQFLRAHFFAFGAYSLNFEVAYYVLSSDYDRYMDLHQQINLKIKEAFDQRGIRFAFPTQTLHLSSSDAISSPERAKF